MYDGLAGFYDKYTGDMNHEKVAEFLIRCFKKYGNKGLKAVAAGKTADGVTDGTDIESSNLVIDVGCGTGKLSIILAKRGFDVTGLDISPEMLYEAQQNAEAENVNIMWLCQDMTKMNTYGSYAAMVCTYDGINHVTTINRLREFFKRAYNFVDPGGLLIFDYLTKEYFENYIDGNVMVDDQGDGTCIWQGKYNEKNEICTYSVTCYSETEDGTYSRSDDVIKEKAWQTETLKTELQSAGFAIKEIFAGKRIFIVAKKPIGDEKNG